MQERTYYSQCGEDYILWQLFKDQPKGFYVDIGACDGLLYSNSYGFDLAGWCGMCVEGHPHYFEQLQKNRPNAININSVVGNSDLDSIPFYASNIGALSTFSESAMKWFISRFARDNPKWKILSLPMHTLQTIFDNYIPKGTIIDFLSIDIEGNDLDALKGLDMNVKWKPRVIVAEVLLDFDAQALNKLKNYLAGFGYRFAKCHYQNAFFCLEETHERIVKECVVNCQLTKTPDPKNFNVI